MAIRDDSLRKFCENVVQYFESSHLRDRPGKFIVPLSWKRVKVLGKSRTLERSNRLEQSFKKKGTFQKLTAVFYEYFQMKTEAKDETKVCAS